MKHIWEYVVCNCGARVKRVCSGKTPYSCEAPVFEIPHELNGVGDVVCPFCGETIGEIDFYAAD